MIHPSIRDLLASLGKHPAFLDAVQQLRAADGRASIGGLTLTAKALYSVLLWQLTERPQLVITDGSKEAEALAEAIGTFWEFLVQGRERPQMLPALDVLPFQGLSPHAEILERRSIALLRMAAGRTTITVAPVGAAMMRMRAREFYQQLAVPLRVGEEVPLADLIAHLESIGYEKREPVEMIGEYSVRGGILDVFPPESSQPVRIEFFGDEIDSMRRFEVASQRSVLKIESCALLPLTEYPRPKFGAPAGWEFAPTEDDGPQHSIVALMDKPLIVWDETESIAAAAARLWTRLDGVAQAGNPERIFFTADEFRESCAPALEVRGLALDAGSLHVPTRPSMAFHGNLQIAIAETRSLVEKGNRVMFFAPSTGEIERLADVFNEYGVSYQLGLDPKESTPDYIANRTYYAGAAASVFLVKGLVRHGTFFTDANVALFGGADLFDTSDLVAQPPSIQQQMAHFSADLLDLKPGDYVVHTEHGVGQFLGLREMTSGETKGDFMLIEYAGGSKLYVPLARMDLVQRFRGGEVKPALDRLGGATWQKTKTRVKAKMRDMAEELLKLYAGRKMAEGFAYSPDSNWQREFEDAFEFAATRDQVQAVKDIKRDMESGQPMDRLLCGDVGFGKTEVVMRAAFKALGDGKQVAILAPTTVLCFQHFETFKRRFAPFPARIDMFSRFRSAKDLKAAVDDLNAGKIDVAIGTHRLLSKDVEFKDLGLVIVDEEQRFGVKDKERLKQFRRSVDVIAMSATPIPRTLHMSLLGLRDLSVIETPPKDRLSIQTTVAKFNTEIIRAAIELEIGRGGQVYFVHNRVDSIWSRASAIQELVPGCRVGVGHGQMPEAALEKSMLQFMRHEFDVFVCTTIVENGLDIPLANTMLIEDAQNYGLSELYQLRGRVGRSNRRAYAYLLVPEDRELTEIARKRLAALKEFSDLGAGFKIAALDLELRGAGNLLGGEQSGHINAVGFDMYVRMLEETMRELKGEELPPEIHATLNLGLDVRIPSDYIAEENQRLRLYKRIANAKDQAERESMMQEVEDRYGPAPEIVKGLFEYSALKTLAEQIGVEAVERRQGYANVKFHQQAKLDPAKLMELVQSTNGAQFTPAGVLRLPIDSTSKSANVLILLREFLGRLVSA